MRRPQRHRDPLLGRIGALQLGEHSAAAAGLHREPVESVLVDGPLGGHDDAGARLDADDAAVELGGVVPQVSYGVHSGIIDVLRDRHADLAALQVHAGPVEFVAIPLQVAGMGDRQPSGRREVQASLGQPLV